MSTTATAGTAPRAVGVTAGGTTTAPDPWSVRALVSALWWEVRPRTRAERWTAGAGLALAAVGLAHLGVQAVDGGAWAGPVSWRKPVVFGVSLGILLLTVAAVLRWVPGRRTQWWVAAPLVVGSVVEYAAIASQRWRGVPSHFNDATPYDSVVFGVMAGSVGLIVAAVAVLTVVAALPRGFSGGPALRLAVLVGLAGVLVSSWVGGRMIAEGTEVVAATGAVPDSVVLGAAGSAKLFHAVGQHGLQVLLAVALLLHVAGAPRRRALAVTALASLGFAGVLGGVGAAALRGEAWLALPPSLLVPAVPGVALLAAAAVAVLGHLRPAGGTLARRPGAVVG
ncbi:hypothetical protein [Aquipuribacter sp. SD81]|uniref:hypothetical protein n=1 Tax=Aquipuribacter sp. SD81 TaxID=3127703 RepID=UPI003018816E